MKTPRTKIDAVKMGEGFYHYVGVKKAIKRYNDEVIDKILKLGRVIVFVNCDVL